MESLTPPLSSSSSEGRSPERYSFQPAKRPRTGHRRHGNSESGDFITLHEESSELEKTEHHFPNFQTFINKLDDAYKTKWATRSVPYQHVIALLVRWEEDDLGVHEEIQSLQEIFRDTYHFDVETWAIPSTKRGYISLIRKMEAILEQYDVEDNLFILYYGGHAYQDEQPQPTWVSKRSGGSSFHSSAFLHLFQEIDADVLLLFDSCQAVPQAFNSMGKGVVSAITATGFEPGAIGTAAEVGSHSFTHSIIQVLGKLSIPQAGSSAPVSDVMLHSLLIAELKKCSISLEKQEDGSFKRDANGHHLMQSVRRRTPIYHWLSKNKSHRPIRLSPLKPPSDQDRAQFAGMLSAQPQQKPVFDYVAPEVLISVRLTPDTLEESDIDAWARWILSLPGGASEVAVKGHVVKIEGLYRSYSSLLVLRMPTEVWTSLPKFKAFGFIGYVTGDNQAKTVNERVANNIRVHSGSSEELARPYFESIGFARWSEKEYRTAPLVAVENTMRELELENWRLKKEQDPLLDGDSRMKPLEVKPDRPLNPWTLGTTNDRGSGPVHGRVALRNTNNTIKTTPHTTKNAWQLWPEPHQHKAGLSQSHHPEDLWAGFTDTPVPASPKRSPPPSIWGSSTATTCLEGGTAELGSLADKDLVCDECQWKPRGVRENLEGYLRKHKNTHRGLRLSCDVGGCTKTFSRLDNLKKHKTDKHGVMEEPSAKVFVDECKYGTESREPRKDHRGAESYSQDRVELDGDGDYSKLWPALHF